MHSDFFWFFLDTIMQPVMQRKKSVELLGLKDLREKSPSRYVLNENRMAADGRFENRLVKVSDE